MKAEEEEDKEKKKRNRREKKKEEWGKEGTKEERQWSSKWALRQFSIPVEEICYQDGDRYSLKCLCLLKRHFPEPWSLKVMVWEGEALIWRLGHEGRAFLNWTSPFQNRLQDLWGLPLLWGVYLWGSRASPQPHPVPWFWASQSPELWNINFYCE